MTTVLEIEKKIIDCKTEVEEYLTDEDKTNLLLDSINIVKININKVNSCYLIIFELLDDLSACNVNTKAENKALKEIMLELRQITTRTSVLFSNFTKVDIIKNGCKSALYDMRANIRTLREYLEDVEETFFLDDEEFDIDSEVVQLI